MSCPVLNNDEIIATSYFNLVSWVSIKLGNLLYAQIILCVNYD